MNNDLKKRIKEVDSLVKELQPEIREAAFVMLQPYIASGSARISAASAALPPADDTPADDSGSKEQFFSDLEIKDPASAVRAITAYFFQEYGSAPYSPQEIKEMATDVGLTVPERIDMTLRSAKKAGKNLYRVASRGKYAPTVHGEKAMKEEFGVKKGNKKRPEEPKD